MNAIDVNATNILLKADQGKFSGPNQLNQDNLERNTIILMEMQGCLGPAAFTLGVKLGHPYLLTLSLTIRLKLTGRKKGH